MVNSFQNILLLQNRESRYFVYFVIKEKEIKWEKKSSTKLKKSSKRSMSSDIFILLLEKSHVGRPVHLEIVLISSIYSKYREKKDQRNPNLGTFLSNASTSKTKHCYENLSHLSIPITKVRFLKNWSCTADIHFQTLKTISSNWWATSGRIHLK